jgi:hypothetical protein
MFLSVIEMLCGVGLFQGLNNVEFLRVHAHHPTSFAMPIQTRTPESGVRDFHEEEQGSAFTPRVNS